MADRIEKDRLYSEQISLLYANAPVIFIPPLILTLVIGYLVWGLVPHAAIVVWIVLNWAVKAFQYSLIFSFRRDRDALANIRRWGRLYLYGAFFSGLAFGSAAFMIYPEGAPMEQSLLTLMIGGIVVGATGAYLVKLKAVLLFAIPTMVPLIAKTLILGGPLNFLVGGLLLLLLAIIIFTARRVNMMTIKGIGYQVENLSLINELREAHALLEQKVQSRTVELERAKTEIQNKYMQIRNAEHDLLLLKKSIESIDIGVTVSDVSGRIVYTNPAEAAMHGYSREELIGRPVTVFSSDGKGAGTRG